MLAGASANLCHTHYWSENDSHQLTCFMPSFSGCRKNEFLTTNRTLLPLTNIAALNLADSIGFVDDDAMIWCSYFSESSLVNMTFTKPVVVEAITSRGEFDQMHDTRHFVSNFSVFVSPNLDPNEKLELLDEVCYLNKLCNYYAIMLV